MNAFTFGDQAFLGTTFGFSPPSPGNLKLWLKPESLSALSNGDPIVTWPDSSGNGIDFVEGTVGGGPEYQTGILNGNPGIRFSGAAKFMQSSVVITGGTEYTMFTVLKFDAAAGTEAVFRNGFDDGYGFLKSAGSRELLHRLVADCVDGATTTNAELWSAVRTSAPLAKFFVNGGAQAITNDTSVVLAPTTNAFLSFFVGGTPLYMTGYVFEVMLYDTNISDANRIAVQDYLIAKYAL